MYRAGVATRTENEVRDLMLREVLDALDSNVGLIDEKGRDVRNAVRALVGLIVVLAIGHGLALWRVQEQGVAHVEQQQRQFGAEATVLTSSGSLHRAPTAWQSGLECVDHEG